VFGCCRMGEACADSLSRLRRQLPRGGSRRGATGRLCALVWALCVGRGCPRPGDAQDGKGDEFLDLWQRTQAPPSPLPRRTQRGKTEAESQAVKGRPKGGGWRFFWRGAGACAGISSPPPKKYYPLYPLTAGNSAAHNGFWGDAGLRHRPISAFSGLKLPQNLTAAQDPSANRQPTKPKQPLHTKQIPANQAAHARYLRGCAAGRICA